MCILTQMKRKGIREVEVYGQHKVQNYEGFAMYSKDRSSRDTVMNVTNLPPGENDPDVNHLDTGRHDV